VPASRHLNVILRLLIIVYLIFIIIVVVATGRSIRGAYAKGGQLSRSQRGIGVGDGWVNEHIRELKKWLIPLTMNNLLVAADNLHALLNDIQTLISATAHGEDTHNIFKKPEFELEEEEAPPLWVVRVGATVGGGEEVR
jgi:hypothetical protein